jgi:hypothetical protein
MKKPEGVETRGFRLTPEVRAGEGDRPARIVGYAMVWDSWSEGLPWRERFRPGAFDEFLKTGGDVRAYVEHDDRQLPLGRTKYKTMALRSDSRGLEVDIVPPDSGVGRDAVEAVRRGDLDGMSVVFTVPLGGDAWRIDDEGEMVRDVLQASLREVSLTADPIFPQTEAAVRSREAFLATVGAEADELRRRRLELLELDLEI